jgi:hypothetical protein
VGELPNELRGWWHSGAGEGYQGSDGAGEIFRQAVASGSTGARDLRRAAVCVRGSTVELPSELRSSWAHGSQPDIL